MIKRRFFVGRPATSSGAAYVPPSIYTPTDIITNQTQLDAFLAQSAATLAGKVAGVQYNATPYTIARAQLRKNYGSGLVICGYGGVMPVFSQISVEGATNLTLYGLEVYDSAATANSLIYLYTGVSGITLKSNRIHGAYYDPNGDYSTVAYPSTLRGIAYITNAGGSLTDITIEDNEIYDVRQGMELNKGAGTWSIQRNRLYRCYMDGIFMAGAVSVPSSLSISWNEISDHVGLPTDIGNPHGDYIQFVGGSIDMTADIIGNIIYTGTARGSGQGIFLDDMTAGHYYTVNAKGNLISIRDYNRGLSIQQALNCNVIGNTVIMSGEGQPGLAGTYVGEYADGGGNVVKNNVCISYTIASATATNNHTISAATAAAYSAIFTGASWTYSDTNTREKLLAAASMKVGGALDQAVNIGAVGSGYVDFTARTINTGME